MTILVSQLPPTELACLKAELAETLISMRHQLVVWIRVEAVRTGLDISGHEASELLERLQQLDGFDETPLQVPATLLHLCDQIIAAGQASLLEYKQVPLVHIY